MKDILTNDGQLSGQADQREFAAGNRVKAFSGIERQALLKLDRLEAAVTLKDLTVLPGIASKRIASHSQRTVQYADQRTMENLL